MLGQDFSVCGGDPRPVAVYFAAGIHLRLNFTRLREEFVDPNVAIIRNANKGCPNIPVHFVFGGLGGQARRVDPIFPQQSCENVRLFNDALTSYVSATYNQPSFDYLELTRDAMTSDGVHFLSDVNLVKAAYLLHWLDLVSTN